MHISDTIGHCIWRQQIIPGPNLPLAPLEAPCMQLMILSDTGADMYLFSAVPASEAQQQPGKVELHVQVSRAVANSLVIVIQGPAVLVC